MKIFLSYGHDKNTPIVLRVKRDLEVSGHSVWIDSSEIKFGDDWRRGIVEGLVSTDWTLGFLSRHSTRNPGVCLDELAIALHVKNGTIATVLVEAETEVLAPVSLSHIQWLDMHEWSAKAAEGDDAFEGWYGPKRDAILRLVAHPSVERFGGEIAELDRRLQPAVQDAEIGALVDGFIGRDWLKTRLEEWRRSVGDLRLFWISGVPGTGKSAFAAWLAHFGKANVIGINLCRFNIDERRDPQRIISTLAFQIATRLPDYRRLLLNVLARPDFMPVEMAAKSTPALFNALLVEPLRSGIDGGRQRDRYLVVIDALDETIQGGQSALAETLAEFARLLPAWISIVVTSRPEPAILRQFEGYKPEVIEAQSTENIGDLRAYVRHWLAAESRGGGEFDERVERIVAASEGNFLYLRTLQDAASRGLLDLAHPDGLPRGLGGLYERWFRRQFGNAETYKTYVPLLEVLAASEHPVPESWIERIFGWPKREQTRRLEGLGSLFPRGRDGFAPFHKSLRDWLVDGKAAGADFVIDVLGGRRKLTDALWSAFLTWRDAPAEAMFDRYTQAELVAQLAIENGDRLREFGRTLADVNFLRRKMMVGSKEEEEARRLARHLFRDLIDQAAQTWPKSIDALPLWRIVEVLSQIAWEIVSEMPDLRMLVIWDDIGRPEQQHSHFAPYLKQYADWNEGVLLLVTAADIASYVVKAHPELADRLPTFLDQRLDKLLEDPGDFVGNLLRGTAGRDYIPERNMSFLSSSVSRCRQLYKNGP